MSLMNLLGNAVSDGLGDRITGFADDIGLNRGGGGESQSQNYLNGLGGGALPTAPRSSVAGPGALGAPGMGGGNAMDLTPQQWDEMARQAGYRDAEQMKQWQMRQNEGRGQAQQPQSIIDQVLSKIGDGVNSLMNLHPKNLINRGTDGLRGANEQRGR